MSDNYISEIMQPPHSIDSSANVDESSNEMSSQGADTLFIKKAVEYIGIFTKADLIKLLKKYKLYRGHRFRHNVQTTTNEARQKMKKKHLPLRRNPE